MNFNFWFRFEGVRSGLEHQHEVTGCYCRTDNTCYVRTHSMHQQIVGRIVFQTYYLRNTCGVGHCRYACITNQWIDLVAFLQENIEYLHKDYARCSGNNK